MLTTKSASGGLLQPRLFARVSLRSRCSAQQCHLQSRLLWACTVRGVPFATKQLVADDDGCFGSSCIANVMTDTHSNSLACIAKGVLLEFARGNNGASIGPFCLAHFM